MKIRKVLIAVVALLILGASAGYVLTDFDSLKGAFTISDGRTGPSLPTGTRYYSRLAVTKTADTADGVCDSDCSLREAVTEANMKMDNVLIEVPAGTYILAIPNTSGSESLNVSGDLDVGHVGYHIVIEGVSAETTLIDGGGLSMNDRVLHTKYNTEVTLYNLTITNGYTASDNGGGIYNLGDIEIDGCVVTGNYANSGGNITNMEGTMLIQNSSVTLGGSLNVGGGIWNQNGGELTIEDSTINANYSTYHAGGIYNYGATLTIEDSVISNNEAAEYGGGIYNTTGGSIETYNTTISDNLASAGAGGGIYNGVDSTFLASNTNIEGNETNYYGGGIYNSGSGAYFSLESSELSENSADSGGGFASINQSEMLIVDSVVNDNLATAVSGGGGGGYNSAPITISGSSFTMNFTKAGGGALVHHAGTMDISDSTFTLNEAEKGSGGAIINVGSAILTVETSTFERNIAGLSGCLDGGGAIHNDGFAEISQSLIFDNVSIYHGGGIYNSQLAELDLINTTIYGNETTDPGNSGGGVYNQQGGVLNISFATITENIATGEGAGIYEEADGTSITNSILSDNIVSGVIENCNTGLASSGYNLEDRDTCGLDSTGDQSGTRPVLSRSGLTDNGGLTHTVALGSGFFRGTSPAIDAGLCQDMDGNTVTVDQRDFARDNTCDIGAYELQ